MSFLILLFIKIFEPPSVKLGNSSLFANFQNSKILFFMIFNFINIYLCVFIFLSKFLVFNSIASISNCKFFISFTKTSYFEYIVTKSSIVNFSLSSENSIIFLLFVHFSCCSLFTCAISSCFLELFFILKKNLILPKNVFTF